MKAKLSDKGKARLFAAFMFGLSVLFVVLTFGDAARLVRCFTDRRPIISSEPLMFSGLFLIPLSASIGFILLLPRTADLTSKQVAEFTARYGKWVKGLLAFILLCIVGALTASYPQYLLVDHLARERGYVPCPKPTWPRHQNDRWALPGAHGATERCPGEGADPNL